MSVRSFVSRINNCLPVINETGEANHAMKDCVAVNEYCWLREAWRNFYSVKTRGSTEILPGQKAAWLVTRNTPYILHAKYTA